MSQVYHHKTFELMPSVTHRYGPYDPTDNYSLAMSMKNFNFLAIIASHPVDLKEGNLGWSGADRT